MRGLVAIAAATVFMTIGAAHASEEPGAEQPAAEDGKPAAPRSPFQLPPIEFKSPDDIGLIARIHFATHTPDFERARAFYRMLGYTTGMSGFPLTNTHTMARALGMFDVCQYELVAGEVASVPGSLNTMAIDLLQFKTPFNGEPPYARPNHLGMAWAPLLTTNLEADYAFLKSKGVEFLSEPFGVPGNQFVFLKDPDGVLYRLEERAPPHGDPAASVHIVAMPFVAINVSNLDASLEFYKRLGYTDIKPFEYHGGADEAKAWGLDGAIHMKGADVALERGDRHVLRITQWMTPFDPAPPYPPPINHIGINRIALIVADLDRAVERLKAQGVEFLSEIAPCCSGTGTDEFAIVHAMDPDGVFVELVGSIKARPPVPPPQGCPAPVIKLPANAASNAGASGVDGTAKP